jgi:hypothetical protein
MDELTGILKRAGYDQKPQLRGIVQSNASTLGLPNWQPQSTVDPTKMVLPYGSSGEVHSQLFPIADLIAETIGTGVYKATGSGTLGTIAEILSPSPSGIVKGLAKAVRGGGDDVARMTAYHGSPHKLDPEQLVRLASGETAYVGGKYNALKEIPPGAVVLQDFPAGRFREAAVGTGEGVQAYGHGAAYLAEREGVAKEYRDKLAFNDNETQDLAEYFLTKADGSDRLAVSDLRTAAANEPNMANKYFEAAKWIEGGKQKVNPGHLYKTDIPDEAVARMLDWDKPLSEQAPEVQAALNFEVVKDPTYAQGLSDSKWLLNLGGKTIDGFNTRKEAMESLRGSIGGQLYRTLGVHPNEKAASEYLRSIGIPGIKYLDQGSRTAGKGSQNFVPFDENLIRILERNSIPTGAQPWKPGEWQGLGKAAPQDEALRIAQRNAALPISEGGLGLPAGNTAMDRAKAMGAIDYYHGTQRLDRVLSGRSLDPKRATSGPMIFGTDSPALASNYAMGKPDTSRIATDTGDMSSYFQVTPKSIGLRGSKLIDVERSYYSLPAEKQAELLENYYRVGHKNLDDFSGDYVLHPPGVNGSIAGRKHLEYVLNKESRGNPLSALRNIWGESGHLYNNPEDLAQIYKVAGYPAEILQDNAPWFDAKGVLTGKAMINNPLRTDDTEALIETVIPALRNAFKGDRTRTVKHGSDPWDKRSRYSPKEWVNELDSTSGSNSYVWTSIPDKVTEQLKKLGYDGIIDTSGKGGGMKNQVVIPFEPHQVRSSFAAFDPMRRNEADLLGAVDYRLLPYLAGGAALGMYGIGANSRNDNK